MAGRQRSTKARARRIDREYFRRTFPLQRWRSMLTIGSLTLGLFWIEANSAGHNDTIYSAGPLAPAHALLNRKCGLCHISQGVFSARVTDQACSACHDGSIHHPTQTFTPRCVDCHEDHAAAQLTAVPDRQCTICHGALKVKSGEPRFAGVIYSFGTAHPEFAFKRLNALDPGTIKFNHAVHLKKDLRGPQGNLTLACSDCHRAGNRESWPWGKPDDQPAPPPGKKYMEPVSYSRHCSACHPLAFDVRFKQPVPHKDPAIVHDFLIRKFTSWISAHPEELRGTPNEIRIPATAESPHNAPAWIALRVAEAEQLLRVKTCKECHDIDAAAPGIPPIPRAKLTARWFTHAEFDHSAHQMLVCTSCHQGVNASTRTSDVLLPGISVCRDCHRSGQADAARATCVECHTYHDPAMHKHTDGKFTVGQVSAVR